MRPGLCMHQTCARGDAGGEERPELEEVREPHAVAVHPAEALQLVDPRQLWRSPRRQIVLPPTPHRGPTQTSATAMNAQMCLFCCCCCC